MLCNVVLTVTFFVQMDETQFYRNQLWTAPELLRMTTRPINGTQKADVYSFAIILQEIMFRAAPYFIDIEPPQCMQNNLFIFLFIYFVNKIATLSIISCLCHIFMKKIHFCHILLSVTVSSDCHLIYFVRMIFATWCFINTTSQ